MWSPFAVVAAVALLLALPTVGRAATLQTFPVPSPAAGLQDIVAGPDGALWFTEKAANKVGRITTGGQITEYPIPNNASGLADTGPTAIVSTGGGLWFLTDIGESLYRMATNGTFSPLFVGSFFTSVNLTPSDTGGVWLMMTDGNQLVRVDPNGTQTDYAANFPDHLYSIAEAPDGSVWFNNEGSYLYRLTDAGAQTSSPLSLPSPNEVSSIAFAPNGTLWFTDYAPNSLLDDGCCGGVDELVGGVTRRQPIGVQHVVEGLEPFSLTVGPDGDLWFSFDKPPAFPNQMDSYDGIGRIDPATGQVQLADTDPYAPGDIAFGSDGALWFVDNGANDIVRIPNPATMFSGSTPGPTPTPTPTPAPAVRLTLPPGETAAVRRTGALRIDCRLAGAGRCSVSAAVTAGVARRRGLKPARRTKTFELAHGSAVLRHAGRVTITLHLPSRVRRAIDHAHERFPVTVTGVSSAPGAKSVTAQRRLLVHL